MGVTGRPEGRFVAPVIAASKRVEVGGFNILPGAGAPVNGVGGTGAGTTAKPGTIYVDKTGKKAYMNTNTLASPTWRGLAFDP